MDILRNFLLVLHFVGLASMLGGVLVQIKKFKTGEARIIPAIIHGAWLQLITGLGLVGVNQLGAGQVNNIKVGIKLVVLIIIFVVAFMYRNKDATPKWVVPTIGALSFANIVIAVF